MKSISLNELNLYNQSTTIYCHPSQYEKIKQAVEVNNKYCPSYIYQPNSVQINTSPYLDPEKQTGWRRTNIMPDTALVKWIDNIDHPPSWAITWGLVEPIMEPVVYVIDNYLFYMGNKICQKL